MFWLFETSEYTISRLKGQTDEYLFICTKFISIGNEYDLSLNKTHYSMVWKCWLFDKKKVQKYKMKMTLIAILRV